MAKVKGTSIVNLRKIFMEQETGVEETFVLRLTPDLRKLYEITLYSSLTPVAQQSKLYVLAAEVLFPEDQDRLCLLGKAIARKSYSGVYQMFLRIPTIQFVVSQAAKVWTMHYDQGTADVEAFDARLKSGDYVVRDFPDLPREMLQTVCGHLIVLLEMAGAKNVHIRIVDLDPKAWRWKIQYE
jgi:hypothetical protein